MRGVSSLCVTQGLLLVDVLRLGIWVPPLGTLGLLKLASEASGSCPRRSQDLLKMGACSACQGPWISWRWAPLVLPTRDFAQPSSVMVARYRQVSVITRVVS